MTANSRLSLPGVPSNAAQNFRTEQVPNMRQALYRLSIRSPNKAQNGLVNYVFPLSPANLKRTESSMAVFYDTAAGAKQHGVQRLVDQYGMSPIIFDIEGTTGWQKHSADGYTYTGIQSIQEVQRILLLLAELNVDQMQADLPYLFTLEFYDYFLNDFWEVVPVGPQQIWQDKQRPLFVNYRFRLVGVRSLAAAHPSAGSTSDPIAAAFDTTVATVKNTVNSFAGGVKSLYTSAASIVSNAVKGL